MHAHSSKPRHKTWNLNHVRGNLYKSFRKAKLKTIQMHTNTSTLRQILNPSTPCEKRIKLNRIKNKFINLAEEKYIKANHINNERINSVRENTNSSKLQTLKQWDLIKTFKQILLHAKP